MIPEDYTESFKALDRAADALESARHNLNGKYYTATANRAYYACYYCIISLLYTKGIYSKTHQGARSKFSELFIKPATFPIHLVQALPHFMIFDKKLTMIWMPTLRNRKLSP